MTVPAFIAQAAADLASTPILELGKGGIVGLYLWRFEMLIKEVRRNGHRTMGLESVIALEVATRPNCPPQVSDALHAKVAKFDAEKAKDSD